MNATMAKVAAKSPLIFSVLAVAGVVGTAVCAIKDYKKSRKMLEKVIIERTEECQKKGEDLVIWPEDKKEAFVDKFKAQWTAWIPTAAVGLSTIACIVLAHKVSASQLAAVSAAAAFGGKKLSEQKWRLRQLIGGKNYDKLESFISGKHVDDDTTEPEDGLSRFHDQYSGTTVYTTVEEFDKVKLEVEEAIAKNGCVSFEFYAKKLGLPTKLVGSVGWSGAWLDISADERTSDNGKSYYAITYPFDPTSDYKEKDNILDVKDFSEHEPEEARYDLIESEHAEAMA